MDKIKIACVFGILCGMFLFLTNAYAQDFEEGDDVMFPIYHFGKCADYDRHDRVRCMDLDEGVKAYFFGTITQVTKNKYKLEQTNFLIMKDSYYYTGKLGEEITFSAKEPYWIKREKTVEYNPDDYVNMKKYTRVGASYLLHKSPGGYKKTWKGLW